MHDLNELFRFPIKRMKMTCCTYVVLLHIILSPIIDAFFAKYSRIALPSLHCIDKTLRPVDPISEDAEKVWRTEKTTIVPIEKDPLKSRPQVVTFDAVDTLIEPSQSIGRWYREALNSVCDMRIRLPRPALFTSSFKKAFADKCKVSPCFGAIDGISSRDWWFDVVRNTYMNTENLNQLDEEEMKQVLPEVFNLLYDDIFGTKEGWTVKEDVIYVLTKLSEWRDQGGGPKLGVLSNFDERLNHILKDLNLDQYFDFVLTSKDAKSEKPSKEIFEKALELAKCTDKNAAYHVGNSLETDVTGAFNAGWSAFRFNEWFDEDFPDWTVTDTAETAAAGAQRHINYMKWGRLDTETNIEWIDIWTLDDVLSVFGFPEDLKRPISTTYIKGVLDD